MKLPTAFKIIFCPNIIGLLLFLGGTGNLQAQVSAPDLAETLEKELHGIFELSCPAVVKVTAMDEHGPLSGTGFFVDPMGTLYTSYSVGGEADQLTVSVGNKRYPAKRLLADARSGIAILKVEGISETPFLPLGRSKDLKENTLVITVGYPMDKPVSSNIGTFADFEVQYKGRFFSTRHIRANIPVQQGQGGSPLLNLKGEVIGILISSLENNTGCFALPIEAAEKVRTNFVRFGEVRHGWIGVIVKHTDTPEAGSVAQVSALAPDTPATNSGLEVGDIVVRVGPTRVQMPEDVFEASFFLTTGDRVPLVVWRNGELKEFSVIPVEHPNESPSLHAADVRKQPDSLLFFNSDLESN